MRFVPFRKEIDIQASPPPSRYLGVMHFNEAEWHFVFVYLVVWEMQEEDTAEGKHTRHT